MLELAGFTQVSFLPSNPAKIDNAVPHPLPGWVLANDIGTHGRLIAFVYAGACPYADGASVWLDAPLARKSVNGKLMKKGHAYPAYYDGLPIDIQDALTNLSIDAWNNDRGLWPSDSSMSPTRIRNVDELEALANWPKMFRRLARYFASGHTGLSGFDAWLRSDSRDRDGRLLFVTTGEIGNVHDLFEVTGNRIRMLYWPEEVVVV